MHHMTRVDYINKEHAKRLPRQKHLEITLSGETGLAKTTIAALLSLHLEDYGFRVNMPVNKEEAQFVSECRESIKSKKSQKCLKEAFKPIITLAIED